MRNEKLTATLAAVATLALYAAGFKWRWIHVVMAGTFTGLAVAMIGAAVRDVHEGKAR